MTANLTEKLAAAVTSALNKGYMGEDGLRYVIGYLQSDCPAAARSLYALVEGEELIALPGPLGSKVSRHLYTVEVEGPTRTVEVHANGRAQAATIAELSGYVVRSINMVG